MKQLQLDYPVWRLSWSAYVEHLRLPGLIDQDWCYKCEREKDDCACLSRTEATCDWYDHLAPDEERDAYINDIYTSFHGEDEDE